MIYDAEATEVEVTHWEHGRGRIIDVAIGRQGKVDVADVYFYAPDEIQEVPLTTLSLAASVASVDITDGEYGFEISIDDGFFEMVINPDGQGGGFDVSLKAGMATVDTCHLSYEDFL